MIEFRMNADEDDRHDMLVEFGSIEGLLAFVEEHGPIVISGTIDNPIIELIPEESDDSP